MLRLISVGGITLAMVIGFIALSNQMHDDYLVRTQVVDAVTQAKKTVAAQKQCGSIEVPPGVEGTLSRITPQGVDSNPEPQESHPTPLTLPPVFTALKIADIDSDSVEVTGIFKDVFGESGKLRIRAGRKIVLSCSCQETTLHCKVSHSDINKKYIPGKIDK